MRDKSSPPGRPAARHVSICFSPRTCVDFRMSAFCTNRKFAGPAAQGRVRSRCDWLFNLISLINGPPRGAWVTYLGFRPYSPLLDPLWEKQESPPTTLRSVFRLFFTAPEASNRPFCALELPTVFRTRFRRPPGSILGAILTSKNVFFGHLCWSLGSSFWS